MTRRTARSVVRTWLALGAVLGCRGGLEATPPPVAPTPEATLSATLPRHEPAGALGRVVAGVGHLDYERVAGARLYYEIIAVSGARRVR